MATVRLSDVIVPEIFNGYIQQYTEVKSELIKSGALVADPLIAANMSGGGLTFHTPSWKDLADDPENISNDDPSVLSVPYKTGTSQEISVRMSRNNSWSTMDLVATLVGDDPMDSIANRVSDYWTRRLQDAWLATMKGVFADNDAAPAGGDPHVQGDLTFDASGSAFQAGVTNFSAESFLDATQTMGDSQGALAMVMMHSIVLNRAKKNNLIEFVMEATNEGAIAVPYFLGKRVIVDDRMPNNAGVFETWLFGRGATRFGAGSPPVPTEVERVAAAGNGGGQDILHNRVEWCIHPSGHAYIGTPPAGGPSNANTTGNLANAASWRRAFTERKQIKIARLKTREF